MTHPIPERSTVRVTTRSACGDRELDDNAARPGRDYEVYAFASADETDIPGGRPVYLLDDEGISIGGCYWAHAEHISLVMTPEQKAARRPPTHEEVIRSVARCVMDMPEDVVDVEELDYVGTNSHGTSIEVRGRAANGLHVGFRILVDSIGEADR